MWFGGVCLDRVRPRLRAMARTAMGSTPQRREEITFFRRVYRDSIISERAYYYDARYYAFLHDIAPRSHDLQSPGRRHTGVRIVVT